MASRLQSVSALQVSIEGALADRFAGALSPRPRGGEEKACVGIHGIDALLHGGLPVGALSELVGAESSGRTTVALSMLAGISAQDTAVAWVDVSDTFDPQSAAECGVDLRRLLWVRCSEQQAAAPAKPTTQSLLSSEQRGGAHAYVRGGGSPHPRSEAHGMSEAVASLLQSQPRSAAIKHRHARRVIGTPGAPNRPVMQFPAASPYREEQVPTDRMPTRRSTAVTAAKDADTQQAVLQETSTPKLLLPEHASEQLLHRARSHSYHAMDRALRAADLLLQAGGFNLLVLDFGSVPVEMSARIPLSTWFRFRAACERKRTTLLLLTQESCAKSSADMMLRMRASGVQSEGGVLTGIHFAAAIARQRRGTSESNVVSIRKPPQSDRDDGVWHGQTAWAVRS